MLDEKVIIVGLQTDETDLHFDYSMQELSRLVQTAGGQLVGQLVQKKDQVDPRTFIGKGKLQQLKHQVQALNQPSVVFNQALTPSQVRNIQDELQVKIIDRMQLILDIFAMRARSKEGRLQVELAQQEYLLPRLTGQGLNLSRLAGGIGTRGPGESQLESDRRYIQSRINDIKKELKKLRAHRSLNRKRRQNNNIFQIGLIGYTNAGKSSLLNQLTQADSFEEDALFATLDPLTRRYELDSGMQATLTDTVGFIQDLPTELIQAFQSTLEETASMDLLIHVIDASSNYLSLQEETVIDLLEDLDSRHIPRLTVYNKADLASENFMPRLYPSLLISAYNQSDIHKLNQAINKKVKDILTPYHLVLKAEESYLLHHLKVETMLEEWTFDSQKNEYHVKGYSKKNSPYLNK